MPPIKYSATPLQRRYDVDWLRTLAMALLIVYHVVLCFQPWAALTGFPQNNPTLEGVWPFMAMINIWRIPILFLVSGMGVRFAMERRDWKQLLKDRTLRILIPLLCIAQAMCEKGTIISPASDALCAWPRHGSRYWCNDWLKPTHV